MAAEKMMGRSAMKHPLDWSSPATLIRGDRVVQFGEGYRQISGPTLAEGPVEELVAQVEALTPADRARMYIANEGGVPQSWDEVQEQANAR